MDRPVFAATLLLLTFLYSLFFSLIGGALLDGVRQRRLGALCAGLGLVAGYPLLVGLPSWLPARAALGVALAIVALLWLRAARNEPGRLPHRLGVALRQAAWLAGLGVLFWLPGALGQHVGLFTEHGGDFTIYAGLAPKRGGAPLWNPGDAAAILGDLLGGRTWIPQPVLGPAASPPAPGWSLQRVVESEWGTLHSGWFGLQQVLFRIVPGIQPEEGYLALLAVVWAMLAAIPHRLVALRAGPRAALLALLLPLSAHGLAAVGYNHFYPQLLGSALLVGLLAIGLLPPGVRLGASATLGLMLLTPFSLAIAYYPMLPLLMAPAIAIPLYRGRCLRPALRAEWRGWSGRQRTGLVALTLGIGGVALLLTLAQLDAVVRMVQQVLFPPDAAARAVNLAGLDPPRPYDLTHLAILLGAFTIWQVPPHGSVIGDPATHPATWLLAIGGGVAILVGIVFALPGPLRALRQRRAGVAQVDPANSGHISVDPAADAAWAARSLGLALLPTAAVQLFVGHAYEYTQYKAASYLLPLLFLWLSLSIPMGRAAGRSLMLLANASTALLIVGLLVFRGLWASEIVQERSPTGKLDVGLRRLVAELRQRDPAAFALAYPPAESPLWELGLRDVQGLIMWNFGFYTAPKEAYVVTDDLPHLWVIRDQSPDPPLPDAFSERGLWAYRPLSSPACRVEVTPPISSGRPPSQIAFRLLGHQREPLTSQADNEFWVFNPARAPSLSLALKEHEVAPRRADVVTLGLRYPTVASLQAPIEARSGDDVLVRLSPDQIAAALGRAPGDLVVVRVPGKGWSGLFCGG